MAVPPWLFSHLERWHHLSFLKTPQNLLLLDRILEGAEGAQRARVAAFRHVIDDDLGYQLYRAVERAKVELSSRAATRPSASHDPKIEKPVARDEFESWIAPELAAIAGCVDRLLAATAIAPGPRRPRVHDRRLLVRAGGAPHLRGALRRRQAPGRRRAGLDRQRARAPRPRSVTGRAFRSHPGMRTLIAIALFVCAGPALADESWILFHGSSDSVSMHGDTRDIARARARLGKDPGHVLWFTRGGKEYVVKDAKALAPVDDPVRRMEELGRKQSILGRHQSTLGARQSALGDQQGALGERLGTLGTQRARAGGPHARAIDEEIQQLQSEIEALGTAQQELGAAQEKLGREQGRLGKEQEKVSHELEAAIARLEDSALSSGLAQKL